MSGHLEPEFVDAVQNITVPIGRDVKFSCHVRHLGTSYKVSFLFFYFPFIFLILLLYFYFQLAILSQHRLLYSLKLNISPHTLNKMIDILDLVILCCRRHFMGPIQIFCPSATSHSFLPLSIIFSLFSFLRNYQVPTESTHSIRIHVHWASVRLLLNIRISSSRVSGPPLLSFTSRVSLHYTVYC